MILLRQLAIFSVVSIFIFVTPASAEKRFALIIGNSAYTHSGELENPKNDAQLIASALRRADFKVTITIDADLRSIKQAFRKYTATLKAAGKDTVGFFYYAGHGTQVKGINYLMPIDANIENESQVEAEAVSASSLMAQLEGAGNKMNLVILDSCRNNPFKRGYRAQVRGLAPMHAPPSTLVGYSTQPGNVAYDGSKGYSPYAIALHRAIRQPGLPLESAFKQARGEVNEVTGGKQIPWEESSLFAEFYFFRKSPAEPVTPAKWNGKNFEAESELWKDVRASRDPGAFRSYLQKHPRGTFSLLAAERIETLKQLAAAKPPEKPDASQPGVYFFDDFNGPDLAKHWDIMNPDPDAYIVENGMLTVLLSNVPKPSVDTIPNIFRLLKPIPKGDWTLTAKLDFLPQTMSEWLSIGVMKRDGGGITTSLQMHTSSYARDTRVYVRGDKKTRKPSVFSHELLKFWVTDGRNIKSRSQDFKGKVKSVYLRLRKTGRRYTSFVKFDPGERADPKKPIAADWISLPKLTSLRVPGDRFTLQFRTTRIDTHLPESTEGLVSVDWVKIEVPN
ncbi:MAG TPA: caspase family protein [Hyphomicrobiaceae bacterium]|nr:caspase family protein [Hyphomicrobiaceae bacterium]